MNIYPITENNFSDFLESFTTVWSNLRNYLVNPHIIKIHIGDCAQHGVLLNTSVGIGWPYLYKNPDSESFVFIPIGWAETDSKNVLVCVREDNLQVILLSIDNISFVKHGMVKCSSNFVSLCRSIFYTMRAFKEITYDYEAPKII